MSDANILLLKKRTSSGVYGLDASKRGEGLNLVDYAARKYGPGFRA